MCPASATKKTAAAAAGGCGGAVAAFGAPEVGPVKVGRVPIWYGDSLEILKKKGD